MRAIVNTPATGDVAFREVAAPQPGSGRRS